MPSTEMKYSLFYWKWPWHCYGLACVPSHSSAPRRVKQVQAERENILLESCAFSPSPGLWRKEGKDLVFLEKRPSP